MMNIRFLAILALLFAPLSINAAEPCACTFTVLPQDEAGCRVYGKFNSQLVGWYRANQTCLDAFQIKVRSIDETTLFNMCPYTNATDVNFDAFMAFLQSNTGPAAQAFKSQYPNFWVDDGTGNYVLPKTIFDSRQSSVDCQSSPGLCWSVIKVYFQQHLDDIAVLCLDAHTRFAFELEQEQSFARIRLCSDGAEASCGNLSDQVRSYVAQDPQKACSSYGFGPTGLTLPDNSTCYYHESQLPTTSSGISLSTGVSILMMISIGYFNN